jgi:GWxTD domain-containing protein
MVAQQWAQNGKSDSLQPRCRSHERMRVSEGRVGRVVVLAMSLVLSVNCTGGAVRRPVQARGATATLGTLGALDPAETYRRAGFLTTSGPVSFVGNVRFLAGPTVDSVLAIVAVSLPSRSLTFTREGERYRATYEVAFNLLQKGKAAARTAGQFRARETVRVSSLRETTRDEESVIFQQLVVVPPGSYTAALTVRDLGSNRAGTAEGSVTVPRFSGTVGATGVAVGGTGFAGLAAPVTVHAATPRASRTMFPDLVVNARSTVIFGRDSIVRIYFEWYDAGPLTPRARSPLVQFSIRSDDGRELYTDSVVASAWGADGQVAAATARVPVAKVGLGRRRISAWRMSGTDTISAPIFVSPADDLAAVSFEELLGYLRYFATMGRLRTLSDTVPEARAGAWGAFLRATDSSPATPEHEGLREYFSRLAVANARFRGENVPGWLSDRGMVYSTLGEPDRIVEPQAGEGRSRDHTQVWEYTQHRLRLAFVEQEGVRRWRLTPSSEAEFQTVAERVKR